MRSNKPRITVKKRDSNTVSTSPSNGHNMLEFQHNMGCRCKKSECLKKYCECFEAGVICSIKCKCMECQNYVGSQMLIDRRRKIKDHKGAEYAMRSADAAWKGRHSHITRPGPGPTTNMNMANVLFSGPPSRMNPRNNGQHQHHNSHPNHHSHPNNHKALVPQPLRPRVMVTRIPTHRHRRDSLDPKLDASTQKMSELNTDTVNVKQHGEPSNNLLVITGISHLVASIEVMKESFEAKLDDMRESFDAKLDAYTQDISKLQSELMTVKEHGAVTVNQLNACTQEMRTLKSDSWTVKKNEVITVDDIDSNINTSSTDTIEPDIEEHEVLDIHRSTRSRRRSVSTTDEIEIGERDQSHESIIIPQTTPSIKRTTRAKKSGIIPGDTFMYNSNTSNKRPQRKCSGRNSTSPYSIYQHTKVPKSLSPQKNTSLAQQMEDIENFWNVHPLGNHSIENGMKYAERRIFNEIKKDGIKTRLDRLMYVNGKGDHTWSRWLLNIESFVCGKESPGSVPLVKRLEVLEKSLRINSMHHTLYDRMLNLEIVFLNTHVK